jgi:hypothetical protein
MTKFEELLGELLSIPEFSIGNKFEDKKQALIDYVRALEARTLDVKSTKDGKYPDDGMNVLWDDGEFIYIGYFNESNRSFESDDSSGYADGFGQGDICWVEMPDLRKFYEAKNDDIR